MSGDVKRFAKRLAVFLTPLMMVVVIPFFAFDPFKIVYRYDDFSPTFIGRYAVEGNTDYFATETYLRSREERRWRSFIFGNSRSAVYRCEDWSRHIDDPQPFYFGAGGESLFGIASKVTLIDRLGDRIDNALLVMDAALLSVTRNRDEHLFVKHPAVSGESWLSFYSVFARAYLSDHFYLKFLWWRLLGDYPLRDGPTIFATSKMTMDPANFQWTLDGHEHALASDEDDYYRARVRDFYPRTGLVREGAPVVHDNQLRQLRTIKDVFSRHQTEYKVIISPLYNQELFNRSDLRRLIDLFGADNVFDFSGVNALTTPVRNFYDISHYRPHVARAVLGVVYGSSGHGDPERSSNGSAAGVSRRSPTH